MRVLAVVVAALVAGLAVATPVGAAEVADPLEFTVIGLLPLYPVGATAWLTTGGVDDAEIHFTGINGPTAKQQLRLGAGYPTDLRVA